MRIKSLLKIETFDRFSEGSLNPLMFMDRSYLYIYRVAREKVEHVFMHEYLRNHISKLYQIFYECYLWPFVTYVPFLAALLYVMYFRFSGWRHIFS